MGAEATGLPLEVWIEEILPHCNSSSNVLHSVLPRQRDFAVMAFNATLPSLASDTRLAADLHGAALSIPSFLERLMGSRLLFCLKVALLYSRPDLFVAAVGMIMATPGEQTVCSLSPM